VRSSGRGTSLPSFHQENPLGRHRRLCPACRRVPSARQFRYVTEMDDARCPWCNQPFRVRARRGSPQTFCSPGCRAAFWSAARRWGERAVKTGLLTVDDLKNGDPKACTLLPGAVSPAPPHPAEKPAKRSEAAATLLEDLIVAAPDSEWFAALPVELLDRLVDWFDASAG